MAALEEAVDSVLALFARVPITYTDERGHERSTEAKFGPVHLYLPAPSDTGAL